MKGKHKYFAYGTKIFAAGGGLRQAKLLSKLPAIKDPMQDEPYGIDFELTYKINPRFNPPDNYFESHGFNLYSEKLINLLEKYEVKFEKFPVKMVDKNKKEVPGLKYYIFHNLEGVQDGLDKKASKIDMGEWPRIKKLVLDYSKFEHKPLVLLDHVYIPIIRGDLREEIIKNKITGINYLPVENYILDENGFPPNFEG